MVLQSSPGASLFCHWVSSKGLSRPAGSTALPTKLQSKLESSRRRRRVFGTLLGIILMLPLACNRDTCNGGLNMSSPHLDGGIYTDAGLPAVRLSWSPGTERGALLLEAYFAEVSLSEGYGEDDDLLSSVRFMAPRTLIVQFTSAFTDRARGKTVTFALRFPDRRTSISCRHRGMSDKYILKVQMTFDDTGMLRSSNLTEFPVLGAI